MSVSFLFGKGQTTHLGKEWIKNARARKTIVCMRVYE